MPPTPLTAVPGMDVSHLTDAQLERLLEELMTAERHAAVNHRPLSPARQAPATRRRPIPKPPTLTVPPSVIRQWPTGDRLLAPQMPDMYWKREPHRAPGFRAPRLDLTDAGILGLSDADLDAALAARTEAPLRLARRRRPDGPPEPRGSGAPWAASG